MKICTICNISKNESFFNKKKSSKDGLQNRCKSCFKLFHQEHYALNKDYYKKKARRNEKGFRDKTRKFIFDYLKSHPCVDCGESDPVVLEFDHLKNKIGTISNLSRYNGIRSISLEINKCEIRCANCHRRKTAKDFKHWKIYM